MVLVSAPVRKSPSLRFCTAGHPRSLPLKLARDSPKFPQESFPAHGCACPGGSQVIGRPAASPEQVRFSARYFGRQSLATRLSRRREDPLPRLVLARQGSINRPPFAVRSPSPGRDLPCLTEWICFLSANAAQFRFRGCSENWDFEPAKVERHLQLSLVGCSRSLDTAQSTQRLHNFPGPLGHLVLA